MWLWERAQQVIAGSPLTREEALRILSLPDSDTYPLVAAAGSIRRHFFGTKVRMNYLVNLKSGKCPEDCFYCSQRLGSEAEILKYSWLSTEEAVRAAQAGISAGAKRVCLVASGRGPSNRDVDRVSDMVREIKGSHPEVEVCACLGFLKENQSQKLAEAGADAYNHNLNTAESNYQDICTSHEYSQREETVTRAKQGGLSPCSGIIAGMGETPEELVDVVFALRELDVDSVPVNFLLPFPGTPFADRHELTPHKCLRILAMVRFVHPDRDVRIAAGREEHLRTLQPLSLEICNSLFLGDYLTSQGQPGEKDRQLIADAGMTILGGENLPPLDPHAHVSEPPAASATPCGSHAGTGAGSGSGCGGCASACPRQEDPRQGERTIPADSPTSITMPVPAIRQRGAGTALPPNA
ncbi:biotin synthase BioB [Dermabacteraceae bacterium P13136]